MCTCGADMTTMTRPVGRQKPWLKPKNALRFSQIRGAALSSVSAGLVAIHVLVGGGCGVHRLFAFGSSLADAERLERHQRLVDQIRNGLNTGALSLPLPEGFGVQAALVRVNQAMHHQRCAGSTRTIGHQQKHTFFSICQ